MEIEVEKDDRKICQEHFQDRTESIFEAIMVIGARARQINRENKDVFEDLKKEDPEMFLENEYEVDSMQKENKDLPKFPKPERLAIKELLNDELEFKYNEISDIK